MSKKKRVIEALKSLLIVGLSVSALWLAADSQLFGHFPGGAGQQEEFGDSGVHTEEEIGHVTVPMAIAVVNTGGCCGLQYDSRQVAGLYEQMAPLLGEALLRAGQPEPATQEQWRQCLEQGSALWIDLQGQVPLNVLTKWVAGKENHILTYRAEHLLLYADEERSVHICFQDAENGQYYICPVDQLSAAYLRNALEQVPSNGALFAWQVEELSALQQHLLVSQQTPKPVEYTAASPLHTDEASRLDTLLGQLSFPVEITTVYDTPEGCRARAGNDTLTISDNGVISYEGAPGENRYPVDSEEGASPEYCAIEAARQLACSVLRLWSGQGGVCLSRVEKITEASWRVEFRYELDNIPVLIGSKGYAASVLVEQGFITQYELQLCTFTRQDEQTTLVLPLLQAAAVKEQLSRSDGQLRLCYQDSGGVLRAGWIVE